MLILHNVGKKNNVGDILRTAAAFGVLDVFIVGMRKLMMYGSHGSAHNLRFHSCSTLDDAARFLREERGYTIAGIEISDEAEPVGKHPFRGPTAFMLGNEGQGLSTTQRRVCDHMVYIPQYSAATASLNVNAACAIVLEHYARWADLREAPRAGEKFVVSHEYLSSIPRSGFGPRQMQALHVGPSEGEREGCPAEYVSPSPLDDDAL